MRVNAALHENVLMTARGFASKRSEAGWAALGAGRWEAARQAFEEALELEESGEALEGLSWSEWWLDDAEALSRSRERAYRLYRARDDPAAAARMATWLASDALDFHGALTVAGGWLQRAHRLLDPLEPGPDHGWLAFHEGFVARLRGDSATAIVLARDAAACGRRFGVADLEMLGLALEGATLVDSAQLADGMRCLDEAAATALTGEAEIPMSRAWACCFLVSACAAVRDYERASEWCDRIADFADRYESRYMLAFCRAEYGEIHLWRGRWSEAEQLLAASLDDFVFSRPGWAGPTRVALAELRRRQGRRTEAGALLDLAGPGTAAQLVRARIALDEGRSGRAVALLDRTLRRTADRTLARAAILELLVHARIARGQLDEAETALTTLQEIVALVGTRALRAAAALAEGALEAAHGDHRAACRHLEDAVDAFELLRAPFEASVARIELATSLAAAGNHEASVSEAGAAHECLLALGAPLEAERAQRLAYARRSGERSSVLVTPRERDVLRLLAEGLTNREIAERLVVSEHTVHRHVTNILRKLDLSSRTAAAIYAVRSGLVESTFR
jgi:DNA-binding NarL/FixJ family response regulator